MPRRTRSHAVRCGRAQCVCPRCRRAQYVCLRIRCGREQYVCVCMCAPVTHHSEGLHELYTRPLCSSSLKKLHPDPQSHGLQVFTNGPHQSCVGNDRFLQHIRYVSAAYRGRPAARASRWQRLPCCLSQRATEQDFAKNRLGK